MLIIVVGRWTAVLARESFEPQKALSKVASADALKVGFVDPLARQTVEIARIQTFNGAAEKSNRTRRISRSCEKARRPERVFSFLVKGCMM